MEIFEGMLRYLVLLAGLVFIGCQADCNYNGKTFSEGAYFPALDGCNSCNCQPDGTVPCTTVLCPILGICVYNGHYRQSSENFPSVDGCNRCFCNAPWSTNGVVGCTTRACTNTAPCLKKDGSVLLHDMTVPGPNNDCNECKCMNGQMTCTTKECIDGAVVVRVSWVLMLSLLLLALSAHSV